MRIRIYRIKSTRALEAADGLLQGNSTGSSKQTRRVPLYPRFSKLYRGSRNIKSINCISDRWLGTSIVTRPFWKMMLKALKSQFLVYWQQQGNATAGFRRADMIYSMTRDRCGAQCPILMLIFGNACKHRWIINISKVGYIFTRIASVILKIQKTQKYEKMLKKGKFI